MQNKGHQILFTLREKEFEIALLKSHGFKYSCFGRPFRSLAGKLFGMMFFSFKMLIVALRFKPDILLSHGSFYACLVSSLIRKPHIGMEDTGNMEQIRLYRPFTDVILVPDSFHLNLGHKQIRYPGNHELAYLHPNRFKPDPGVLDLLGVKPSEPYVVLRFVGWHASHDFGHHGLHPENKLKVVQEFNRFARVFISSEKPLDAELSTYKLPTPPERAHDVIAFSSLVYGESATMASEAAVLGVPAIYLDNTGRCYTREEENKYGLVFNYNESEDDQQRSIEKGIELLSTSSEREDWIQKRIKLLQDKIDVTSFLIWFVENWPGSYDIMKKDAGYSRRFT